MNFKDRVEQVLKDIQKVYSESYNCFLSNGQKTDKNIIRGRARCVSGRVEDLTAELLFDWVKMKVDDVFVFVDLPLSFETCEKGKNGKSKLDICYPDIVVARHVRERYEILYMVELKVNLGWGRHKLAGYQMVKGNGGEKKKEIVKPIEQELYDDLNNLRNVGVWAKWPAGTQGKTGEGNSDRITFKLSSTAKYDLVICSSKNVSKAELKLARARIARNDSAMVQMYVLSDAELSVKYTDKKDAKKQHGLCSDDVEKWGERINSVAGHRS